MAESDRLLSGYTPKGYPGFESLLLRSITQVEPVFCKFFLENREGCLMRVLAYFPVFGWFFPMFFTRITAARYHARQGFGLFLNFALWFGVTWFLTHGIPRFLSLAEVILLLLPCALYLGLLFSGMVFIIRGQERPLPLIGKWSERLRV